MTIEMKLCPFCGCKVEPGETTIGHYDSCFFTIIHQRGVSDEEENSAWNRRRGDLFAEVQQLANLRSMLLHICCGMATTDSEMASRIEAACLKIGEAVDLMRG
jgi:hypothetical protein